MDNLKEKALISSERRDINNISLHCSKKDIREPKLAFLNYLDFENKIKLPLPFTFKLYFLSPQNSNGVVDCKIC